MNVRLFCALTLGCGLAWIPALVQGQEPAHCEGQTTVTLADDVIIPTSIATDAMEWPSSENDGDFAAFYAVEMAELDAANPCTCEKCQAAKKDAAAKKKQAALKKAVASAYAPVFYNNKFDYVLDPAYEDWHLGEDLKRLCVGDCTVLDLGGQYRARLHNERNHRGLGITGRDDDFLLHRTRLFANLELGDRLRFFGEFLDAESNYETFTPRAIEMNRADMLNLFVEAKITEMYDGDIWMRVGRQELIQGNQRLISPLDWANTRRNFEGVNVIYKSKDWNIEGFLTRPVIVDPVHFDSPDDQQGFSGLYTTYKGRENETIDVYYIYSYNELLPNIVGTDGIHFHTTGGRWLQTGGDYLWEVEGAYQFGENDDGSDHSAGFAVLGIGKKIEHPWKPTVWAYYDWSSGGDALGQRQGFDHLFPLSHKYHGWMDLFARSNIESPNVFVEAQPSEKIKVAAWYHYLMLQTKSDTPYNVNMTPFNPGNPPASADLGHEIDLTIQYLLTARMDILFGYSHFFVGDYYKLTPGIPYRDDADFFYTHFTVNF